MGRLIMPCDDSDKLSILTLSLCTFAYSNLLHTKVFTTDNFEIRLCINTLRLIHTELMGGTFEDHRHHLSMLR